MMILNVLQETESQEYDSEVTSKNTHNMKQNTDYMIGEKADILYTSVCY